MKQLPNYWMVKMDQNHPLWEPFRIWFLKKITGYVPSFEIPRFFGYDERYQNLNGYNWYDNMTSFSNNPTLITLEEWDECVNGKPMIDKVNDEFIVDCTDNSYEERQQVYKFLIDNRDYDKAYKSNNFNVIACNKKPGDSNWNNILPAIHRYPNHPILTFEQFKEKYLNMNEKEIIGYKLIKPEYKQVACIIAETTTDYTIKSFIPNSSTYKCFKKAGVLDLWFEPVYKEETKTIRMGGENGFDLTIKNGKIYHKSEDITSYVESIHNQFSGLTNLGYPLAKGNNSWSFHIKDIILSKTGCQTVETKLSEWLNLYKLIS